jgi:hypothetical protein
MSIGADAHGIDRLNLLISLYNTIQTILKIQIKLWKLEIYEWAGETPTSSVNASYCPSECSDEGGNSSPSPSPSPGPSSKRIKLENDDTKGNEARVNLFNNFNISTNPDAMASLLGKLPI